MLGAIFHHFIPPSLYGGQTAFPTLAKIDRELQPPQPSDFAASLLVRSKADLYGRLRKRFDATVAQALTLKILNLFLARHHLRTRSASVLSRPFGLVVDPSNMCQLACPGCVHSAHNEALKVFDWPKGTLSEGRLAALLKQYGPYAVGVYFCNYGEPLLNLHTPRLIRMAKTYLIGTALSTSLSVARFDAEAYVESGLDFMVLSIDGATQPVTSGSAVTVSWSSFSATSANWWTPSASCAGAPRCSPGISWPSSTMRTRFRMQSAWLENWESINSGL